MTITLNSNTAPSFSGANVNFAKPSVSTGDVLIAIIGTNGTITTPSGWTLVSGSSPRTYTRTIDGTEGSTLTFVSSGATATLGQLLAFSGVDGSFPIDRSGTNTVFNNTIATNPGITPRLDNEYLVYAGWHNTAGGGGPSVSSGSGTALYSGTSSSYGFAVRTATQTTAAATGALNIHWSISGSTSDLEAISVRPSGQNIPPTVTIPAPSALIYGNTFTTTATGVDVEGAVTYAWTNVSPPGGSTATISGASTATMTFKPDIPGTYTFQCTVTDTSSATASATISFLVRAEMWTRVSGTFKAAIRRIRNNGAWS